MKYTVDIDYYYTGSGYSHTETIETGDCDKAFTAEEYIKGCAENGVAITPDDDVLCLVAKVSIWEDGADPMFDDPVSESKAEITYSSDDPICDDKVRKYYWLDLNYIYGDHSVSKFALYQGEYDEDGEKDRDSEEVVCWETYEEIEAADDSDEEPPWEAIDKYINDNLGFVPDYEVG